jgi:hypothetical protein
MQGKGEAMERGWTVAREEERGGGGGGGGYGEGRGEVERIKLMKKEAQMSCAV